jgi:ribosomal protein S18
MQKEDITTWLSSRDNDWKEGLALFVAFTNNKNMLRVLLSHSETVRSKNMLKYELKKIIRTSTSVSSKNKNRALLKPSIDSQTRKTPKTLNPTLKTPNIILRPAIGEQSSDPVLIPLENKSKEIYVEAASLFYQLLYLPKSECEISCLRILDMMSENQAVWNQINYYKKYKFLPSKNDIVTQLDMKTRITTLRTYISRHHKLIANAKTEVTRQKYQLKLNEFIAERNDLELKLSV